MILGINYKTNFLREEGALRKLNLFPPRDLVASLLLLMFACA